MPPPRVEGTGFVGFGDYCQAPWEYLLYPHGNGLRHPWEASEYPYNRYRSEGCGASPSNGGFNRNENGLQSVGKWASVGN